MKWEIKKLLKSKLFLFAFICLLITNCVACFFATDEHKKDRSDSRAISSFVESYRNDPASFNDWYEDFEMRWEEQIINEQNAAIAGEEPDMSIYDIKTQLPESNVTDVECFLALKNILSYGDIYNEKVNAILLQTKKELSSAQDSYQIAYLQKVESIYTHMKGMSFEPIYVNGWDIYFDFEYCIPLLFVIGLLAAILLSRIDNSNNMSSIIKTSKIGQNGILFKKTIALAMFSFVATFLFSIASLLIVEMQVGVSGGNAFLSTIPSFSLCPYPIYIWEYATIRCLLLGLAMFVFSLFSMTIARLIKNVYSSAIISSGIFCLMFFTMKTATQGTLSVGSVCNLVGLSSGAFGFHRYNAVNAFGHPINALTVSILIICLFLFISSTLLLFAREGVIIKRHLKATKNKRIPSLIALEWKKTISHSGIGIICIIIIIIYTVWYGLMFSDVNLYKEVLYRQYVLELEGPIDSETYEKIYEIKNEFDSIALRFSEATQRFEEGDISIEEFQAIRGAAENAEKRKEIFALVEEKVDYCQQNGFEIVYEKGWQQLFDSGDSWFLIILVVAPTLSYMIDRNRNFICIQQSTKNGRTNVFYRKAAMLICMVLFSVVILDIYRLIVISSNYPLNLSFADLRSVLTFCEWDNLSIKVGLIITIVCRWFAVILFSLVGLIMSALIKHTYAALGIWGGSLAISHLFGLLFPTIASYLPTGLFNIV